MWIQLILNFIEVVALRQLQSDADMLLHILQKFSKQLSSDNCGRLLTYINFHILYFKNQSLAKKVF